MMSMRHIPLLLLSLFALPVLAEAQCATPVQCNQAGTSAYQAGRFDEAIEAFERQLRRVERDDAAGLELALNNLILANLRAGEAGMARAWLELALDSNLSGSATRHNLTKVAQALDYPALSASPAGRYLRYSGQAVWSELQISEDGRGGYLASFAPCALAAGSRTMARRPLVSWTGSWSAMGCRCAWRMPAWAAPVPCNCCVRALPCRCSRCSPKVARITVAWASAWEAATSRCAPELHRP